MKVKDLVKNHNLTGSLLESIQVSDDGKTICLEIDYCYWQQTNYNEEDEETGILLFTFKNCDFFSFDDYNINSDEIVKVELNNNELVICVENDLTGNYHYIRINAQNVTVSAK